ncbi:VPS9 domain-containing protein 1-like isoform X2 [Dysidea avara]|uniref:VPS9 domain-containing protein 1-like isoform X2 n=1 Tax=Dysidea avara TaxID=196820 RepID=UPI003328049B
MEEAKMKNQKLMSVYQEHLRKRASSLLPQDCNRLNLDMWKKIEQNNMIARMKEKALQQKLHERTSRISKAPKPKIVLVSASTWRCVCKERM